MEVSVSHVHVEVEVFNGNWAEYAANRLERGLGDEVSNFKYRKLVEA